MFICALWSPAEKGLTSWLSFVVSFSYFYFHSSFNRASCKQTVQSLIKHCPFGAFDLGLHWSHSAISFWDIQCKPGLDVLKLSRAQLN